MAFKYPSFKNEELNNWVNRIGEIDAQLKSLEGLKKEKKSLEDKIISSTYFWLMHYELEVRYGTLKRAAWFDPYNVSNPKSYEGGFLETQEEAMGLLNSAKEELKKRVGEKVVLKSGKKGCISNYNITLSLVYQGGFIGSNDHKKIYREDNPSFIPNTFESL